MGEEEGLGESCGPGNVLDKVGRKWLVNQRREAAWLMKLKDRKWWERNQEELLYDVFASVLLGAVAVLVFAAITVLVWQCGNWLNHGEWMSLTVWDGVLWLDSQNVVSMRVQHSLFQVFPGLDKIVLGWPLPLAFCATAVVALLPLLAIPKPSPPLPPEDFQPEP